MDDDELDSIISEDTLDSPATSEYRAVWPGKRPKIKFTSIVEPGHILTDDEIRQESVNFQSFVHAECSDMLTCLQWMAKRRLICNTFPCPRCDESCAFQLRSDRSDKYNWTCNPCNFKKSVREGSFFAGSHLCLPAILQLIYMWTLGTKREEVQTQLGIRQRHTLVDWYAFVREICARRVLDNPQEIGGLHEDSLEGIVVTFGIFNFLHSKERKEEVYWVVFGIESGTDRCFLVPVESCDPATIVAVLRLYVQPGTVLCGRPFQLDANKPLTLSEEFTEFADDYCITVDFTDFSSAAVSYDLQKSDLWKLIQRRCKAKADLFGEEPTSVSLFQSYVQEAIWRQMYSENLFSNLLADIAIYYPF